MKTLSITFLVLGIAQCVIAQAIAPREYPPGKEPYYYSSDSMPWYDSYGRLRYGPQGIPARQYEEQQRYQTQRLGREFQQQAPPPAPVRQDQGIEPGVPPPSN